MYKWIIFLSILQVIKFGFNFAIDDKLVGALWQVIMIMLFDRKWDISEESGAFFALFIYLLIPPYQQIHGVIITY